MQNVMVNKWQSIPNEILLTIHTIPTAITFNAYTVQVVSGVNKTEVAGPGVVFGEDLDTSLTGMVLTHRGGTALTWEMTEQGNHGRWVVPLRFNEMLAEPFHEDRLASNEFTVEQKLKFVGKAKKHGPPGISKGDYDEVSDAIGQRVLARIYVPPSAHDFSDCKMWSLVNPLYGFIGDVGFNVTVLEPTDPAEWL